MKEWVRWFDSTCRTDVAVVGGKNSSLGELMRILPADGEIHVAEGFATTAAAYWYFLDFNGLRERLAAELARMDGDTTHIEPIGRTIRRLMIDAEMPREIIDAVRDAYVELSALTGPGDVDVAVRSSATAEDLPQASFAGQHETFLNVRGADDVIDAVQRCFASTFTDRAIAYREQNGFDHMKVALSAGVQRMVRSDRGAAGVIFTLDPDSGFPNVVVINGAWGLGENVVKGLVTPDQFMAFKPLLSDPALNPIIQRSLGSKAKKLVYGRFGHSTREVQTSARERETFVLADKEVLSLARCAAAIEKEYGVPMDIEWAKDGTSGELFIVQARPETVQSRKSHDVVATWHLRQAGDAIVSGIAVGESIASGKVVRVSHADELEDVPAGAILVTAATEPDWTPVLQRVAGIITDSGGRTCHAAIVARELGIPAIVGTETATHLLADGDDVTMSCAEGETGVVYHGLIPFDRTDVPISSIPPTRTQVMVNAATPAAALRTWHLPIDGIGLARIEFLVSDRIKVHPMALVRFEDVTDPEARDTIERLTRGYTRRGEYFVEHLAMGIAQIAAAQYPRPVIVRTSDFKTNEYARLVGGRDFEPREENPMLGLRGASRYYSDAYAPAFALECEAIRRVREVNGFTNVIVMIPFCRTPEEADRVLEQLARNGLTRGRNGLQVYVMAEIPSNVILATEFAKRFDGFSIGSNDLTQLVLGVDRDSSILAHLFDERNEAVKRMIHDLIVAAHGVGRKVGICGQAPSDHPDFLRFLIEEGIDSVSLNIDSVLAAKRSIAEAEVDLAIRRESVAMKAEACV